MKAFICANYSNEKCIPAVKEVCDLLSGYGVGIFADESRRDFFKADNVDFGECDTLISESDMIITVGGDGTILKWGKKASALKKPLLGVNTGRLGFMATLESNELYKLERIVKGNYSICSRMLLDIEHKGKANYTAINDIVLSKSRYSKLPEFSVSIDGHEFTKIRADGIIFCSPTGSTAYSLSAGGAIIQPDARCIEFTPLCAHTLFSRPMILSADSTISVKFKGYENPDVILSVDGSSDIGFLEDDELIIKRSDMTLDIVDINDGSFYDAVHDKLMRPLK